MLEKIKEKKYAILAGATVAAMQIPGFAFASDSTATITTALTAVADDVKATFIAIAPVALGIATLGIAWKYGLRFFKSLSK